MNNWIENELMIEQPDTRWQCLVLGYIFIPDKGKEPNCFHRIMHYIFFGFKWEKK